MQAQVAVVPDKRRMCASGAPLRSKNGKTVHITICQTGVWSACVPRHESPLLGLDRVLAKRGEQATERHG